MSRKYPKLFVISFLIICAFFPNKCMAYVAYESSVFFLQSITGDLEKFLPRAMGNYIFQNRYDFSRGMTFMIRDIKSTVYKSKDLEEIRREAYERLMRDIPFCVEALKGGELKLDTHANNVAGRLGMIAYSITLLKIPDFPDLEYYEKFMRTFEESINDYLIDLYVYYDGYGDFKCIGDLMERFKRQEMPTFKHVRNPLYAANMKEDRFAMFRPPDKFERFIIETNIDLNRVYNDIINDIMDAFVFIWKCSGMDLEHPSYGAPPGTMITRLKRGNLGISAGALSKPSVEPAQFQQPQQEAQRGQQPPSGGDSGGNQPSSQQ